MIVKINNLQSLENYGSFPALTDEIKDVNVFFHRIKTDNLLELDCKSESYSIFFVISGNGDSMGISIKEKDTIVPRLSDNVYFKAFCDLCLLEIRVNASKVEMSRLNNKLPILLEYDNLHKYTEDCKSEKTISRMIFNDGDIPRLTLGSVEVEGPDSVLAHCHPEVDQFFFSLPENNAFINVDGDDNKFSGCSIVHIPLGSTHSVRVCNGSKLHYLWCDYLIDEKSSEYIRSAHKML